MASKKKDRPKKQTPQPSRPKKELAVSVGIHLDQTMNMTEEIRLKKKHFDFVKQMARETRLTFNEIEALVLMYEKWRMQISVKAVGIEETDFIAFLHDSLDLTNTEINRRIATATHILTRKLPNRIFSMESWIKAISLFARGTFEEKTYYCFRVYDTRETGFINKDGMIDLLQNCLIGEEGEEALADLIEVLTKKADIDRDGKISLEDFQTCVSQNRLLLECFGQCLPGPLQTRAFLNTFCHITKPVYVT